MKFIEELQNISQPHVEAQKAINMTKAQAIWEELKPYMRKEAAKGKTSITGLCDDEEYYLNTQPDSIWCRWYDVRHEVAQIAKKEGFTTDKEDFSICWYEPNQLVKEKEFTTGEKKVGIYW